MPGLFLGFRYRFIHNEPQLRRLMTRDTYLCRFCFEPESSLNPLISPCWCDGSQKYVHRSCLNKWRIQGYHNRSLNRNGNDPADADFADEFLEPNPNQKQMNFCSVCQMEYVLVRNYTLKSFINCARWSLLIIRDLAFFFIVLESAVWSMTEILYLPSSWSVIGLYNVFIAHVAVLMVVGAISWTHFVISTFPNVCGFITLIPMEPRQSTSGDHKIEQQFHPLQIFAMLHLIGIGGFISIYYWQRWFRYRYQKYATHYDTDNYTENYVVKDFSQCRHLLPDKHQKQHT